MKIPRTVKVYKDGRRECTGEVEVSDEQQEAMAKMLVEMLFSDEKDSEKKGA